MVDDFQELRIAPVMTGGTSLAVWMGGATAELYAAVCARPCDGVAAPASTQLTTCDVYGKLLDLTRTRARVDVITGTSAGGLNGTLLAAAWRYRLTPQQFSAIRETWLDIADLKKLMRPASMTNPPSLLKGDAYFRVEVEKRLESFRDQGSAASAVDRPLDLLITVTTVTPEPVRNEDDFGEVLAEVNYAHRLHFTAEDLGESTGGAGRKADWTRKLAIAGRTSACIPGVFEPSFLPIGAKDATSSGLPDFEGHASFATSKFAVDGGVVNNLPLGEALDRIFYMTAPQPVRRLVLYVSPTPSKGSTSVASGREDLPSLRASLLTLVSGPRAEGIAGDVDRLRRHNAAVTQQATTRLALIAIAGNAGQIVPVAERLLVDYADRRTEGSVATTLDSVQRLSSWTDLDRKKLAAALRSARRTLVPQSIRSTLVDSAERWSWGIAPVEHAVSMVSSLIRRTLSLARPADSEDTTTLLGLRGQLDEAYVSLENIRGQDKRYWADRLTNAPDVDGEGRVAALTDWAQQSYDAWPGAAIEAGDLDRDAAFEALRTSFQLIARVLSEATPVIRKLAAYGRNDWSPEAEHTSRDILREMAALAPDRASVIDVQCRLMALHIMQLVALGDVVSREQRVELMQLSFNAKNQLDKKRLPQDKLAGPELGRLGAFLKRSWRANDWLWGRMDGAARLAEMLLDPRRLRQLGRTESDIRTLLVELGWNTTVDNDAALKVELAFLADPAAATPQSLPVAAATVSRRLQQLIASEELPIVRDAIDVSTRVERANDPDGGRWVRLYEKQLDDQGKIKDVALLVCQLDLGRQTVGSELGYGLLNRTLSQGAAVVVNALAGDNVGVKGVAAAVKPLRSPLLAVNAVVRTATVSSPFGKAFTAFVFALAGAVLAVRFTTGEGTGGMVAVAALLLAGAIFAAFARTRLWWHAIVFLPIAAVITLALVGKGFSDVVYSAALAPLPGWKRWGFIDDVSVLHWFVAMLLVWGLSTLFDWLSRKVEPIRLGLRILVFIAVSIGAVVAVFRTDAISDGSRRVLTGQPQPTGIKHTLTAMARNLGGYRFEVVLLALVVGGILLGTAYDVAVKKWWHRARAWWRTRG